MVVQLPSIFIVATGDSITDPNWAGTVQNTWVASAQANLAAQFSGHYINVDNIAVAGTVTSEHWTVQAQRTVANTPANIPLKFVLWWAWSPNDGVTAAAINSSYDTYQAQFLALCQAKGFIPVLGTNIPCNGIPTATDDAARVSINNKIRASASTTPGNVVLVVDFDAVMSDHQPHANIIAGYSPDGTHPTTALGEAAMWPPLSATIAAYLTSIGMT